MKNFDGSETKDVVGVFISFNLETWDKGLCILKNFTKEVIRIVTDPLSRHETKYIVIVEGDKYGIPVSEINEIIKQNEQFELF